MTTLRFVVTAAGAAVAIALASLLWPKFTGRPTPPPLSRVRDVVEQTPIGRQASDVLGIENDTANEPVDVRQWAAEQGNAILSNIAQTTQQTVVTQVVRQIIDKVDSLAPSEKVQLQQILCATPSAAPQ